MSETRRRHVSARSGAAAVVFALLVLLLLPACGDDKPQPFHLRIDSPAAGSTEIPFPVAVVRGIAPILHHAHRCGHGRA